MLLALGAALLALQTVPADTVPVRPAPTAASTPADAYLDPGARTLVQQARERRARVERRIDGYRVLAKQRGYAGLHTLGRNRTLYTQEMAARVDWRRDGTGRIEVLGGREASPAIRTGAELPGGIENQVTDLAFDPDRLQLSLLMGMGGDSDEKPKKPEPAPDTARSGEHEVNVSMTVRDPLAAGSEAHYRFRTGESTAIRLPDGRTIRITELEVIPRRSEPNLLRGSLWVDDESHGVVRSAFRLARPFDLTRDVGDDVPGALRLLGSMRASMDYLTVEYALWEGRWWLPRVVAVEGSIQAGVLGKFPLRFERSYSGYEVTAAPDTAVRALPAVAARGEKPDSSRCVRGAGRVCSCPQGECRSWEVVVPPDTAALVRSAELPASLADGGEKMITGEEVHDLERVLDRIGGGLDGVGAPQVHWQLADLSLLRYNRVEGLSLGARAGVELGPWAADATARFGLGDLEPGAELGVARQLATTRYRLAGYR
ncbi:MAG: hypothetical protein JO040_15195, partial [Gemmatimonadetes bacterium]|nr:hypothetical protein [Gemmatimonadota bacterium]